MVQGQIGRKWTLSELVRGTSKSLLFLQQVPEAALWKASLWNINSSRIMFYFFLAVIPFHSQSILGASSHIFLCFSHSIDSLTKSKSSWQLLLMTHSSWLSWWRQLCEEERRLQDDPHLSVLLQAGGVFRPEVSSGVPRERCICGVQLAALLRSEEGLGCLGEPCWKFASATDLLWDFCQLT